MCICNLHLTSSICQKIKRTKETRWTSTEFVDRRRLNTQRNFLEAPVFVRFTSPSQTCLTRLHFGTAQTEGRARRDRQNNIQIHSEKQHKYVCISQKSMKKHKPGWLLIDMPIHSHSEQTHRGMWVSVYSGSVKTSTGNRKWCQACQ